MDSTSADLSLTLIGGPTVLIETGGLRLITDPTFDPPRLYQTAPVHFEKTIGPALDAEAVLPLDAVLLSHDQHLDNLDHAGRALLPKAGAVFTTQAGATRLGGETIAGLAPFETAILDVPGKGRLFVTAAPARHGPPGIEPISGDVVGFLLGRDAPGDLLYVTGDTVFYDGVAEVARRFSPRVVIVFAGSAEPRGRFHMTMDANDALETAGAFPGATLVAAHTDGWVHFKESAADLAAAFATLGIAHRLARLEPGRPKVFPA
ncbi:MBL fold metallo-hydrolase [Xanthobacter autotrophicus]|uniref:MBL fold metallo-hydrolase n=1 Tax=Xanthobacter TaxID=279 RepID=UPI0024AA80F0|nr:MBL fold metallo-hydrolase [Xanthobacter autotrophicus]MDI4663188.1 MBL fold metallo-hydrolase [Xanthobacter autotrophicus]